MPDNYLTRTTFRAAHDHQAAVSATVPLRPLLGPHKGSINPGKVGGEVTVVLYVSADSTLEAAGAAVGAIRGAYEHADKPLPGRLNPTHVEAFKADPPDWP